MTRDEVYEMAVKCGFPYDRLSHSETLDVFERIVVMATTAEHEACKNVVDAFKVNGLRTVVDSIADAMRERSNVELTGSPIGESSA